MSQQNILKSIEEASKVFGKTWPLYSFVTSNPLSGYEKSPFKVALRHAKKLLNARVFPEATLYRQAWEKGEIAEENILHLLKQNGLTNTPEFYLRQLESQIPTEKKNSFHSLDRIMVKWLSAFMDEGLAEWDMPGKEKGFYDAWRSLALYDDELLILKNNDIPKTSSEALAHVLKDYIKDDYIKILVCHLAALPGWTGYIKHRSESNSLWQQKYPINIKDYLAVRLYVAQQLKIQILPQNDELKKNGSIELLQYLWLKAWEKSWQDQLIHTLEKESKEIKNIQPIVKSPDAQMVFCIDTRSELIRRHVETKGNYETFGYAGFFGIAMDYKDLNNGLSRKSCPPIVSSSYQVSEIPQEKKIEKVLAYKKKNEIFKFGEFFLSRMKNMLPSAFGYVEGSGFFYGLSILARTLVPGYFYKFKIKNTPSFERICEPKINRLTVDDSNYGIPLDEKVAIVKSAFELTGWKYFSPLVLFIGHGSHSANNPFGSSLDCGACAASPGRHNARMLAKLANLSEVRKALLNQYKIIIPYTTVFVGAEHNTTTDKIEIFDTEVPNSHQKLLFQIKSDLFKAQKTATQDRLGVEKNSISKAQQKANNWGETRPEWGLAKNAGFIIGPRELTKNVNLYSRCFLHSYDWEMDTEGTALESILQGPMVVTQWINNHYYFSTVDNENFGGGTKITHNITGKFGVVQGNGGDLKMGLPLQSIRQTDNEMYHQPLRLTVLVQAPLDRVQKILLQNEHLKTLLDNEWIYLLVMEPLKQNVVMRYENGMEWIPTKEKRFDENKYRSEIELITLDGNLV
jgi:uncharacterized protein YbcC (UPF0753/DUF2309 family)